MIPVAKPMMGPLEEQAVLDVIRSGKLAGGDKTAEFEVAWADFQLQPYAVAVTSGTAALEVALEALTVDSRDEVIVPALTFNATSSAVMSAGMKPVFVDVDPITYTMDPRGVRNAITKRTRAILPVHLYGLMADMDALDDIAESKGVAIIEDAAQAHDSWLDGMRPGDWTTSIAQCYSFYATKNMTTGGEGGAVTTSDSPYAETLGLLREHGSIQKYSHILPGHNLRMTEMQAAFGLVQLESLPYWQAVRQRNAELLTEQLRGWVITPNIPDGYKHSWHQYAIIVPNGDRDGLARYLWEVGVGSGVHYPLADPLQPMYGYPKDSFPEAEYISKNVLSLPVGPWVSEMDIQYIVARVQDWVAG